MHRVSFREPPFLRLIVRPRHLHSWQDTPGEAGDGDGEVDEGDGDG
jgi:hypothetical protein